MGKRQADQRSCIDFEIQRPAKRRCLEHRDEDSPEHSARVALSIWMIVTQTLKSLPLSDLLNCRRVSRLWNHSSSYIIRKKELWTTNISKVSIRSGKTFFQCFSNCEHFPCTRLLLRLSLPTDDLVQEFFSQEAQVSNGETISDFPYNSMFRVLSNHGHHLKALSIYTQFRGEVEVICKQVLRRTENIESLKIFGDRKGNSLADISPEQFQSTLTLPHLKKFDYEVNLWNYGNNSELLKMILNAAPRMQQLDGFKLDETAALVETGKHNVVKELDLFLFLGFPGDEQANVKSLAHFANLNPAPKLVQFVVLEDGNYPLEAKIAIAKILEASQESLKTMQVPSSHHMRGVKFPKIFPNMETLRFVNIEDFDADDESESEVEMPWECANSSYPRVTHLTLFLYDISLQSLTRTLQDYKYIRGIQNADGDLMGADARTIFIFPSVQNLTLQTKAAVTCNEENVRKYLELKFPKVAIVKFANFKSQAWEIRMTARNCLPRELQYLYFSKHAISF